MIVAAIALTALINFSSSGSTTTDLRAKATASTLELIGTVVSTDDTTATLVLQNVELAPNSRSGPAKNLGTWTISAPPSFSVSQAFPGAQVAVTIQAQSFDINSREVAATNIRVSR